MHTIGSCRVIDLIGYIRLAFSVIHVSRLTRDNEKPVYTGSFHPLNLELILVRCIRMPTILEKKYHNISKNGLILG